MEDSGDGRRGYITPTGCNRDKMRCESAEERGQDWQRRFLYGGLNIKVPDMKWNRALKSQRPGVINQVEAVVSGGD